MVKHKLTKKDAQAIAELHNANGGCTWSLVAGDLQGQDGYVYGRHERAVVALRQRWASAELIQEAHEFLDYPLLVGTWFDKKKDRSIIEVLEFKLNKEIALGEAMLMKCKFLWDLKKRKLIRVRS